MKFIYLCLLFTFFQSAFGVEFEEPQETIVLTELDEAKFDRFLSNKKLEVRKELLKCMFDHRQKQMNNI